MLELLHTAFTYAGSENYLTIEFAFWSCYCGIAPSSHLHQNVLQSAVASFLAELPRAALVAEFEDNCLRRYLKSMFVG